MKQTIDADILGIFRGVFEFGNTAVSISRKITLVEQ